MSGISLRSIVQEALEDKVVLQRVDVRDAQAEEHEAGGGAAPHTEEDALPARVREDVPDHEEVVGELGVLDDGELVVEALMVAIGRAGAQPLEALAAEALQVRLRLRAVGRLVLGQPDAVEVEADVAGVGDALGVGDGLREFGKELEHLVRALEVEGVAGHLEALAVVDVGVGGDADADVLHGRVFTVDIMEVVGGGERDAKRAVHLDERGVDRLELGNAVVALELQVEVVLEDLAEPVDGGAGLLFAARQRQLGELAAQAAGEGDDAAAVAVQQVAVDAGLVVEAVEVRAGDELDEVRIPRVVARKQGKVVRIAVRRCARCVGAGRQVDLTPQYGVDAGLSAGRIEIYRPVHHAVVRNAEGIHPELLTPLHHGADPAQPIQ